MRPAANASPTTGSGASPVSRSDSQSESKPLASSESTSSGSGAAEQLDGPVDHVGGDPRRHDLDGGDLEAGALVADRVHQPRRLEREQAGLLDRDPALRHPVLHHALVGQRLAERRPHLRAHAHELERLLRQPDRPHAVVDAAGAEAGLRDREAAALLTQQARRR